MEVQPLPPEAPAPADKPSSNNKIWIAVGCVVLACCCLMVLAIVVAGPALLSVYKVSGSNNNGSGAAYTGNADPQLRTDTLNAIKAYETGKSGCADIALLTGQILSAPDANANGIWTERWQVKACDTTDLFTVTFTPSPNGGTDYSVHPEGP